MRVLRRGAIPGRWAALVGAVLLASAMCAAGVRADEAPAEPIVTPAAVPASPDPEAEKSDWDFLIAPYVWFAGVNGSTGLGGNSADVDATFWDIFSNSDFVIGGMANIEAMYKRRFGMFVAPTGLVIEKDGLSPGPGPASLDVTVSEVIVDFGAYYNVIEGPFRDASDSPTYSVQATAGGRYVWLKQDFDFLVLPSADASTDWIDPVLGARAAFKFGKDNRWGFTLRTDFGGFGVGSDFTTNSAGTFQYFFPGKTVTTSLVFGYRGLYQDYDTGSGPTRFTWDVWMHGPLLGLAFWF